MAVQPTVFNARSLPKLGTAVRRLRLERGMSQAELARTAGVSRQWLISLEQGNKPGLEVGRLMRVLDGLDASLTIRDDREDA
jgi:transcriptional regulator with XRE-family HTH domain